VCGRKKAREGRLSGVSSLASPSPRGRPALIHGQCTGDRREPDDRKSAPEIGVLNQSVGDEVRDLDVAKKKRANSLGTISRCSAPRNPRGIAFGLRVRASYALIHRAERPYILQCKLKGGTRCFQEYKIV